MSEIPVVIICGGKGTRMRGSTSRKKELVEVGGRPIIWHVMRIFSAYGFNRFVLTLGHDADQLRRYFMEYDWMTRDLTIQLGNDESTNDVRYARGWGQPAWEVSLVNTGLFTEKAQRIMRVANYIEEERFFAGYGDDVSDVDLSALVKFHKNHGRLATITAVQINLPYGVVDADDTGLVSGFIERPPLPHWINGGFMLFEREVLDIIATNQFENLETEVLPYLAEQNELMIYRHTGFWQSMNTMKDTLLLEKIWRENPPWKVWDED